MADEKQERQGILSRCFSPSRRYCWLNFAGVTLGVFCLLTSYNILFFIQSSLYSKDGLGTIALAINYVSQLVTCFFLPPLLMRTIGCKWSLVASAVCIAIFVAANLQGSFSTLIPAAICVGVGFATMWVIMNTIVGDLAVGYARLSGAPDAVYLARFFSTFYAIILSTAIWGNVISSQILSKRAKPTSTHNTTVGLTCGAHFCSTDQRSARNSTIASAPTSDVSQEEVNNLVITGLSIIGLGIFLILVLLASYKPKVPIHTGSSLARILATLRFHRKPNVLLLIVCTLNAGLMMSFFSADFTEAFVTCSIGISNVGLVTTSLGIAMTIGTALLYAVSFIPRPALFLGATVLNLISLGLMLFWTPNPEAQAMFYVIAGMWGVAMAVWKSQLPALYGDAFPDHHQEAYSVHRLWDCVGFVIGFAWSYNLCMNLKIYITLGFLLIGTIGYVLVEMRLFRSRKTRDLTK